VQALAQSSVPGGRSVLRGIRQLAPGQLLVAEGGSLRLRSYWSLPPETADPPPSFDAAVEELRERLRAAVRSHLVADVPVGAFLSGGLDSSALTLEAREASGGTLHTFSVRFDDAAHDEGAAAHETASALGSVHHELRLGPDCLDALPEVVRLADEPFAVSSSLALHRLARFAREHVKVVLTGDGADELLGGYPWRHEPELGRGARPSSFARGIALTGARSLRGSRGAGAPLGRQLRSRLRRMWDQADERFAEIQAAFAPEELGALLAPELAPLAARAWAEHPLRAAFDAEAGVRDPVNRRLRADLRTTLVDEMLTKVDRMTMAASLEARVPFLDRAFVEWALRQPGSYKIRRGRGKALLREALAARLPRTARRPKRGFDAPLGRWLRGGGRELLGDLLSTEAVSRRGLFRPGAVASLVEAHLRARADHSRKLFGLLVVELWLRESAAAGASFAATAANAGASAPSC
jgi:asparagine synthase (glutamine-hydrolysing)